MKKKCPPGVICVENMSFVLVAIILLGVGYLIYANVNTSANKPSVLWSSVSWPSVSWPYTNVPANDVLLNPYDAPYRDERYLTMTTGVVPINVSTNVGAVDTSYRQVGIITPLNGEAVNNILPLMGRPLFTNRDKWQYYAISNQHNNVKLPISFKGRSALNDTGVDKIYEADTVYVEGYGEPFKVTMYENDTIKYLPFV